MLKVDMEFRKGILFVRLRGSLTQKTVEKFSKEVIKKLEEVGIRSFVLNMSGVKEIDFKGMNQLLYAYEICKKKEGKIFICGESKTKVMEKLKKNRILKYFVSIENELEAFDLLPI